MFKHVDNSVDRLLDFLFFRENPRDALVLQKDIETHTLTSLPEGSVIGTSSLRRTAQLAKKYPHLKVENIRGNLNTRLKKLDDLGQYQAIILASAGLIRIGWKNRISKVIGIRHCDFNKEIIVWDVVA